MQHMNKQFGKSNAWYAKHYAKRLTETRAHQKVLNAASEEARLRFIRAKKAMIAKYANDDPSDMGRPADMEDPLLQGVTPHTKNTPYGAVATDAHYNSRSGHYYLGRRRRRIGAGFGRRRRAPMWKSGDMKTGDSGSSITRHYSQMPHRGFNVKLPPLVSKERIAVACDGHNVHLHCRPGLIKIKSADYGRTDATTCNHCPPLPRPCARKPSEFANHKCHSHYDNTMLMMRNSCDGKNRCGVMASTSVFGEPCAGTHKYLTVTYKCGI